LQGEALERREQWTPPARPTAPATTASVREARVALAEALEAAGRHAEADEAYAQAASDPGPAPSTASILMARSHLAFAADRGADAIRFVLEAAATDPLHVADVAECIRLIGPAFADRHGDWVVGDWRPTLRAAELGPTQLADVELTAAMVEFCRGRFADGQALLDAALQVSRQRCEEMVPRLLESDGLLVDTAESQGRAATMQACAVAWRAIGRDDRALDALTEALSAGFPSGEYPEAETYRLRAELRLAAGDRVGAASDLFEAGCRFGWRGDFEDAVRLLESSAGLDPDRQETYWYWADDLRINAAGRDDEAALLDEALSLWERGASKGAIAAGDAWAYLARAGVFEARSDLDPAVGADSLWQAVVDAESALALDPDLLVGWTRVSRLFRSLGHYSISSHALARSEELCGDELDARGEPVLSEQVAARFTLDPGAVSDTVEQYRRLFGPAGGWVDMVAGLTAVRLGDFARGIANLEAAVDAEPDELRRHVMLARARLLAAEVDRGRADCERTLARLRVAPARVSDTWDRAWLACFTGHLDEARSLVGDMERCLSTSGQRPADVAWLSMLVCLADGDGAGAEDQLERMLRGGPPIGDLIDVDQDLSIMARLCTGRAEVAEVVRTLQDRVREDRLDLRPPTADAASAEREVRQILDDDLPDLARVASMARLASINGEAQRFAMVARTYAELEHTTPPLPAAPDAFRRTVELLLARSEEAVRAGQTGEAVARQLDELLDLVHGRADTETARARTVVVLALVRLLRGADPGPALSDAMDAAKRLGSGDPVSAVAASWRELLPDVSAYWRLDDALATGTGEAGAVRWQVRPYLATRLRAGAAEVVLGFQTTPLALELGADLIPPDAAINWETWDLFTTLIPQLKTNLAQRTGVGLDVGVRVRGSTELAGGDYAIVIDDIRRAQGTTLPGWWFVPGQIDLGEAVTPIPGTDPRDGRMGRWVPEDHADRLDGNGLSAIQYAVAHLEAEVRQNLPAFLTLDAVENLLADWGRDPALGSLLAATLPDRRARCRFAWVARALAGQQVPLLDGRRILEATASAGIGGDLWRVVRAVRLALRASLPVAEATPIRLDPDLEVRLGASDRRGSTADPAAVWELLTRVREALPEHSPATVVVESPDLRPLVERLVQRVFPDVAVLSGEEVVGAA
jgi:tetratricopeptide (TPR) repeat protein